MYINRKILAVALSAATITLSAQTTLSLRDSGTLESILFESSSRSKVQGTSDKPDELKLLLALDSDSTPVASVEDAGLKIDLRLGRYIIGSATASNVEAIAGAEGVKSVNLDSDVKPLNYLAATDGGTDKVHAGSYASLPAFTGKGILTGIVDRGFDGNHIMYTDQNGDSRIRLIAMYPATTGAITYRTPEEIASFGYDYTIMTHGSHVLGTMSGGNYISDTGKNYCGVAPDADIAITSGILTEANIILGINEILKLARERQQPCVINISQGNSFGPHDGSDTFTSMLNELAGNDDLTIVMAAGNEGKLPIAVTATLTEDKPYVQTALKATEAALITSNELSQGLGYIDVWSEDATPVEAEFQIIDLDNPTEPLYTHLIPEGENPEFIGTGRAYMGQLKQKPTEVEAFKTNYSNGYLGGQRGIDAASGRYRCQLRAYLTSRTAELQGHVVALLKVKGQPGKRVFIYNENDRLAFSDYNCASIDAPTSEGTISNIACGNNLIVAGSHAIRNAEGSPYDFEEIGKVCSTSSWGRVADGRLLPDVTAPGYLVYSTLNGALVSRNDYESVYSIDYPIIDTFTDSNGSKHYVTQMGGTSMAAPYVSGVIALMLQANPELTTDGIRDILHSTATPQPTQQSGFGKVNALEAVKAAYSLNSIKDATASPTGDISVTPVVNGIYSIFAPGEKTFTINVFTPSGVNILTVRSFTDTTEIDLSNFQSGVYVISVKGSKNAAALKIHR